MDKRQLDPWIPKAYQIVKRRQDTEDVFTFWLRSSEPQFDFLPGQFNMVWDWGKGEVPISICGSETESGTIVHTIRSVGAVTDGLMHLKVGDSVGLRGPFGTAWPMHLLAEKDAWIVCGGIGLAPLRPSIVQLTQSPYLETSTHKGIFIGARSEADLLYPKEIKNWKKLPRFQVEVTVDRATPQWHGDVGLVTALLKRFRGNPKNTVAFLCGPEVMMVFVVRDLLALGVPEHQIYVSLERGMKCAIGFCGHCQLGPKLLCRDGPVFCYSEIKALWQVKEL